ncbi:hypothetical protein M406DRAFT_68135 [Cryphonectria parasitica EP155]|uniref:Uncharacterized protein n=1 Tax=Cryphonectria parasitica (strain ATCC 38755 / EP155) TaxID=660469 RepID=A0A9P4Y379_CRYP1|nr:uncharacterized protein M406DRAFT_68135 [Cryphonectria parasitica EP155]KAF3765716.1 hypothetical protein M406DRAFT_68135 [Cryphonectria parasitica EP155]
MGSTSTTGGAQYLSFDIASSLPEPLTNFAPLSSVHSKEGSRHNNYLPQHRPNIPVPQEPQYALNLFTSTTEAQGAIRGALGLRKTQTVHQSIARMGKILDDIDNAMAPK